MSRCETIVDALPRLPWRCADPLPREQFEHIMRRSIFDCCKWHTQVEGCPILCSFPLLLDRAVWESLARQAEMLSREALAAERELLERPDLHADLGLPRPLRRRLREIGRHVPTCGDVRVMRFDFHWTTNGWNISEANTDAAGGFIEASGVTRLIAEACPGYTPAGDPAGDLSAAIHRRLGHGARVGLMHLTVHTEDRQIMHYLGRRLQEHGLSGCLFSPCQLRWDGDQAVAACAGDGGTLDLLFRFFPAEWLPQLPPCTSWSRLAHGGRTPVCNPAYAVLTQSKRFPLVWDRLTTPLPMWRALLPETVRPRHVGRGDIDGWVLKPALGHEGHNIGIRGVTGSQAWQRIARAAWWRPRAWAMQRRFTVLPLPTPDGPLYPCLGVYVIDGRAAGAYVRVAPRPLIDDRSREIALLLAPATAEDDADATGRDL
jgi:glutathionylspermidine synthase